MSPLWQLKISRKLRMKFEEIHWCWLSDHQKVLMTNVKSPSREIHLPNWKKYDGNEVLSVNWQTGGGTKSALALFWIDLRKFWQANIRPCIPLNPNMCDMWGGTSHIFSARSLWRKIIRSGGVRSSNWLSSQLENLTRYCPPWLVCYPNQQLMRISCRTEVIF